ncbi:MAG TPA: heparan-alpha-glucosaminide N-acetyltransferase domain-containing protein [Bryobacteraceae bacterium]|nr:heparan-alpha-glucosaminide N-acetyltransferase domain-containing protein [Bryobacteraceae bacterium]
MISTIQSNNRVTSARLSFLDWARGFAVLIILQGHVFHSFTKPELRTDGPYVISQFMGGVAPAIFLSLTGITLAFLMDKRERQGLPYKRRWVAALRRGGYLLGLAFLFRLQMFLSGWPSSPAPELLKVDVLNCMGFAIGLYSLMAFLTTAQRAKVSALVGIVIAAASPLISAADWSWLPPQISAYFVPNFNYFAFFPWAAFIAFGVSMGSVLRLTQPDQMNRLMQWSAIVGLALIFGGQYCSNFPYSVYPKSEDFWLNSPWLIFMKLGAFLELLAVAYLWNEYGSRGWSWLRQFGTTSLLIYWVHIELVYGRWFGAWKNNLNAPQCVACAVGLILLMLGMSVTRTRLKGKRIPLPSFSIPYFTYTKPSRVPGD